MLYVCIHFRLCVILGPYSVPFGPDGNDMTAHQPATITQPTPFQHTQTHPITTTASSTTIPHVNHHPPETLHQLIVDCETQWMVMDRVTETLLLCLVSQRDRIGLGAVAMKMQALKACLARPLEQVQ
jgi:hypothetical protein